MRKILHAVGVHCVPALTNRKLARHPFREQHQISQTTFAIFYAEKTRENYKFGKGNGWNRNDRTVE